MDTELYSYELLMANQTNTTTNMDSASWLVSGLGISGIVFNIYVIVLIVAQGLRTSHFSKIYFVSLAVADLVISGSSVAYTFIFHHVVHLKKGSLVWIGANGIAWVSVSSSLLHVTAITADRFIATMFPFFYKVNMTRTRVSYCVIGLWIVSIVLVVSMAMYYRIAFWCAVVGVPIASLFILLTYVHIISITVKRKRTLRLRTIERSENEPAVSPDDVLESMNTIFLGLSITVSYVICNLPLSITLIKFLYDGRHPSRTIIVVLHTLLTSNAVVDPILYALSDLVRKRMNKALKEINRGVQLTTGFISERINEKSGTLNQYKEV